ncbi:unnamed protein product [Gadus morhua 'NCC']
MTMSAVPIVAAPFKRPLDPPAEVHLEPDPYTAARSICSSLPLLLHQHRSITGAQSAAHCMSLQTLSGLLPALASRYINDDSSAPPHT